MKKILPLLAILLLTACDNSFLNDTGSDELITKAGNSSLILSPNWGKDTYLFSCPVKRNAEFTIEDVPEWLELENTSGILHYIPSNATNAGSDSESVGELIARAKPNKAFSKTGVYLEYITVNVKGSGKFRIPVYYLTEGNPKIQVNKTLSITYDSYSPIDLQIKNNGEGILYWQLVSMPAWLLVDNGRIMDETIQLVPGENYIYLPLKLNADQLTTTGMLTGELVMRTNDKQQPQITIQVNADLGSPVLSLSGSAYNRVIDFGTSHSTYSMFMMNQGNGMLVWNITNLPEWLTVDKASGTMRSYNSETLLFNLVADKLVPGLNSAEFQLQTNDPQARNIAIKVIARGSGNASNISAIEGNIVDAAVDKATNILYYVISQPNKLIAFDLSTKKISGQINLSNAPTCLEFNEDFSQAAIGHGGLISMVDMVSKTVTKSIQLTNTVNDIAWATPTSLCYTELAYNSKNTFWINLSDNKVSVEQNYSVDGKTVIKKIPGRPFILATRQQTSPSGIFTLNASDRKLHSYAHKSMTDFWLIKNGEYFISRGGDVYRTLAALPTQPNESLDITPIGKLTDNSNQTYVTHWVDYSAQSNQLFTVNYNIYSPNYIYQFEANDFKLVRTYPFDKMYQEGTVPVFTEVEARYVFANKEGTQLTVLRKGKNNTVWSMEFINVIP